MKIAIIGTGYVGVVTAAVFAKLGHQVWGLDIDEKKIAQLQQGQVPFFEPGLDDLVQEGLKRKKLQFGSSYPKIVPQAEVILICVGTPPKDDGETDLTFVLEAARSLAPYLQAGTVVVVKSTVPPNTHQQVRKTIASLASRPFFVAVCPEFLVEGKAIKDTLKPSRVVIGADNPEVIEKLLVLHQGIGGKRIVCSPSSAQLLKYAANVFLGLKISFAYVMAELCERYGADIDEVVAGLGADPRIGEGHLRPGVGMGGSCLPKDIKSFDRWAGAEVTQGLFRAVEAINERQIERALQKVGDLIGPCQGKTIALLGLAFKANTDDLREAPSRKLIRQLLEQGAKLRAYDPQAMEGLKKDFPEVRYCTGPYETVEGADLVVLVTEWNEFKNLDWKRVKRLMKEANIVDGRNLWKREMLEEMGFKYEGFGR